MTAYPYVHLDVFTTTQLLGNALAVFPESTGLSTSTMQAIARELNISETVFLREPDDAACIKRARIFTPSRELDFAGHPTIGTAYLLSTLFQVADRFAIEENVGAVAVESDRCAEGLRFWFTTPPVHFAEVLAPEVCAQLLGLQERDIADSPPQFLSAGSPLLFVQLTDAAAVDRAELQQAFLPRALGSLNSGGTFIFARSGAAFDVYSRMFAPQIGISEDPATGGATGPLAAYMQRYGMLPAKGTSHFTSEQGVKMKRHSTLFVRVASEGGESVIKVGGHAVMVSNGQLELESTIQRVGR